VVGPATVNERGTYYVTWQLEKLVDYSVMTGISISLLFRNLFVAVLAEN